MASTSGWYDAHAPEIVRRFEAIDPASLHVWLSGLLQNLLSGISASDLRIGARFTLDRAKVLHAALRDAAQTIDRMPSTFMTYPMGGRILPVERGRLGGLQRVVELNPDYLTAFGWMRVPGHLWRAMRRHAAWIEPTLIAEWMRLMREYAKGQDRPLSEEKMAAAMQWSDPARDVSRAREVAVTVLQAGSLCCSWTGRPLSASTLDIDHMFPWAAWPCGDLWNLLPAHREVNQRLKRDRLPSAPTLFRAEGRIVGWWEGAYLTGASNLVDQFVQEARASLPGFSSDAASDIFASVLATHPAAPRPTNSRVGSWSTRLTTLAVR